MDRAVLISDATGAHGYRHRCSVASPRDELDRVDIVARGVIKACLELGYDPAEKIAIFRIPGAWEEEGFKILRKYGIDYADRSMSLNEAAGRAVEKIGAAA